MENSKATKLRALVVDDDATLQRIVTQILHSLSIGYQTAFNGREALEELKKGKYDLILMDVKMPEQDGLDTVRWIRDLNDSTRTLPIFAVTSYDKPEHVKELKEAGYNEHFAKPLDREKLRSALNKYFAEVGPF
jgi:CheY-like chemotaxis protein